LDYAEQAETVFVQFKARQEVAVNLQCMQEQTDKVLAARAGSVA
jgi:hypothetical protein